MLPFLAWPIFVLLPGASSAILVRPSLARRPVLLVAVAPALTFATSIATASALAVFGVGPWPGVLVLDGALVLGAAVRLVDLRRRDGDVEPAPRAVPPPQGKTDGAPSGQRTARWLLVVAIGFGTLVWFAPGVPSVPLNRDVQNHAYFVARIIDENSVDPAAVLTESPTDPVSAASFYPLASHVTVATARQVTGLSIAALLIAWAAMSAVVVLPCGLYALMRRLAPDRELAAGFAALAGACLAVFPYQPLVWGGVAFVVTMTAVPGVIALVLEAVDRRDLWWIGLGAFAVVGVALAHTSEVVLLAIVLGAFAAWDVWSAGSTPDRRRVVTVWAALAAMCAVLLAPSLVAIVAGGDERSAIAETLDQSLLGAATRLVAFDVDEGPPQVVMGVLALIGVVVLVAGRRARPLRRFAPILATTGGLVLLVACTTMTGGVWDSVRVLTVPWYRSYWRLMYNVALFAPLFVGIALAAGCGSLERRTRGTRPVIGTAIAVSVMVISLPVVWATVQGTGVRDRPFSAEEVALFHDVGRDAAEGAPGPSGAHRPIVLNQENDGSAWAYAVAGVPTFSGMLGFRDGPDAADRAYLLRHVGDASTDERVQELIRRWNIRYVLVGDGTYSRERASMRPDRLRHAEGFRVIEHRGRFWVFEVPRVASVRTNGSPTGSGVTRVGPG